MMRELGAAGCFTDHESATCYTGDGSHQRLAGNLVHGEAVRASLDNYKRALADIPEVSSRVRAVVRKENDRISEGTGDRLEYEVFGQHAYFALNVPSNHDNGNSHTHDDFQGSERQESTFLVRAKLPSRRGMNGRKPHRDQPSDYDISQMHRRPKRLLEFGNIRDVDGNHIGDIRGIRVAEASPRAGLLGLIHEMPAGGKAANFFVVGKPKKRKNCTYITGSSLGADALRGSLSSIDELHFLPHGNAKDRYFVRLFYTVTNQQEQAWQLRTAYLCITNGALVNDRAVYTENHPSKYVSLHKTKDGRALFVAVVSHCQTFKLFCIKREKRLKMRHVPLPSDGKVLLEHRLDRVYSVHSVSSRQNEDLRTKLMRLYGGISRSQDDVVVRKGKCENVYETRNASQQEAVADASVEWAISMMNSRMLSPVKARKGRHLRRASANTDGCYRSGHNRWVAIAHLNAAVTDIDMMHRGLVIYAIRPPSTPIVMIRPFTKRQRNCKAGSENRNWEGLCMVGLPLEVGVIEPQSNTNYRSTKVEMVLNSPGTRDICCTVDLSIVARTRSANNPGLSTGGGAPNGGPSGAALNIHNSSLKVRQPYGNIALCDQEALKCDYNGRETQYHICHVHTKDGLCRVPVTLVKATNRKAKEKNCGESGIRQFVATGNKCLVYVYGAYGERLQVNNDVEHNALLELGYTLCFAHVRGGGELGEKWHMGAVKSRKPNGFHDLVDVLEFLIAKNIAQRNKIAVAATSAGGILGGCLYNLRPELCSCIVLTLPFLDVVGVMGDPSQPLTQLELGEFGNVEEANMDAIYSYSPCSNAVPKGAAKPALVIQCNDNDARAPWRHCANFVDLNSAHSDKIFMKKSAGKHTDGANHEERVQLVSERIILLETLLS
ncbi:S9 family peptidase [Babesia caballi]|uniref:Prolyl endopeptidase n=1 Tax=Babesia caballi TaxID=5871 RepID=A0AAV4LWS0_BABCB|nr:S9 family peptidase [Babesia caballi]